MPDLALSSSTPEPVATANAEPQTPRSDLQKATEYWAKEFAKKPTDLDAALAYAKNLKALGQKGDALSVLQQASTYHGADRRLASEYGRLALELDQISVADKLLAAADDPATPDWRVISARGTVLAKQGKYSEAIPFYERARTLADGKPSVLNNLALAYAMNGDAAKAEELLRTAASGQDADPKTRQNLALVLGLQGKYDEATQVASAAMPPDNAAANTALVRKIVKLDPKAAPAGAVPATAVAKAPSLKPAATDVARVSAPAWPAQVASTSPTPAALPWSSQPAQATAAPAAATGLPAMKPSAQ